MTLIPPFAANCPLRHSVSIAWEPTCFLNSHNIQQLHRDPCMDDGQAIDTSLWSLRVYCSLPCWYALVLSLFPLNNRPHCPRSLDRQLHRTRRKVKLVRGDDSHVSVILSIHDLTLKLTRRMRTGLYIIVAITFWFYPGKSKLKHHISHCTRYWAVFALIQDRNRTHSSTHCVLDLCAAFLFILFFIFTWPGSFFHASIGKWEVNANVGM